MSQVETWTIRRLLEWTVEFFKKKGADSPRLDAEVLLAHALNCQRITLYTNYDDEPGEAQRTVFRDLVKRRGAGEPVAYLVGHKEFFSLDFKVTPDTLIPRPETEQLVLEVLEHIKTRQKETGNNGIITKICDLGTGCGIIPVVLAKQIKNVPALHLTAIDLSKPVLTTAQENATKHHVSDKIEFIHSDLFRNLERSAGRFDLIVSNPPYVTTAEYDRLDPTVRDYEPRQALVSGPEGTEIIARILNEAPYYLKRDGKIFIEISPFISPKAVALFDADSHWKLDRVIRDFSGLDRVVTGTLQQEEVL